MWPMKKFWCFEWHSIYAFFVHLPRILSDCRFRLSVRLKRSSGIANLISQIFDLKMSNLRTSVQRLLALCIALTIALIVNAKEFVVVIDAGHGGKDPGAIGKSAREKDVTLSVAKLLGDKITKNCNGVKVVYTRTTDKFVELSERCNIANNAKGNLFISIHTNAVASGSPTGVEVYTLGTHKNQANLNVAKRENSVITLEKDYTERYSGFDPNSPESYIAFELNQSKHIDRSIEFAIEAEHELVKTAGRAHRPNGGVLQAGFLVLVATSMPSVLVELDFISTRSSEKFLSSADGQEKMAKALYNAFNTYYNNVNPTPRKSSGSKSDSVDEPDKEDNAQSAVTDNDKGIEYRVQILTSGKKLPSGDKRISGLDNLDYYVDNNIYKYTIGHFDSEAEATSEMRRLRKRFSDCFVIKFANGKRVN